MKLYIAYYESYVSIIEGKYNRKKDKFNIKNCTFLSAEDVNIDLNDKYSLLKEALKINKSKVKDVVLLLHLLLLQQLNLSYLYYLSTLLL